MLLLWEDVGRHANAPSGADAIVAGLVGLYHVQQLHPWVHQQITEVNGACGSGQVTLG